MKDIDVERLLCRDCQRLKKDKCIFWGKSVSDPKSEGCYLGLLKKEEPEHSCENCIYIREKRADHYNNGTKFYCDRTSSDQYYHDLFDIKSGCPEFRGAWQK